MLKDLKYEVHYDQDNILGFLSKTFVHFGIGRIALNVSDPTVLNQVCSLGGLDECSVFDEACRALLLPFLLPLGDLVGHLRRLVIHFGVIARVPALLHHLLELGRLMIGVLAG